MILRELRRSAVLTVCFGSTRPTRGRDPRRGSRGAAAGRNRHVDQAGQSGPLFSGRAACRRRSCAALLRICIFRSHRIGILRLHDRPGNHAEQICILGRKDRLRIRLKSITAVNQTCTVAVTRGSWRPAHPAGGVIAPSLAEFVRASRRPKRRLLRRRGRAGVPTASANI